MDTEIQPRQAREKNLQDAEMPWLLRWGGKVSIFAMKFQGPKPGCGCLEVIYLGG